MARNRTLWTVIVAAVVLAFGGSFLARKFLVRPEPAPANSEGPKRIVSLAPSITESLFALGLGDRVVGVTSFCNYPPEAKDIEAKVGGYMDTNYEAILALKPDLVVTLIEQEDARQRLESLGLKTLQLDHHGIAGILASITRLGGACGAEDRAGEIVAGARRRLTVIRDKTRGLERPRVMISVGRNMGTAGISDVFISGPEVFPGDLIETAGGVNCYQRSMPKSPKLSVEAITLLDPEVIIDIVVDLEAKGLERDKVAAEWRALSGVSAVKNGRVHVFTRGYSVIPGPRFVLLLEDMARVIHPELDWGRP